MANCQLIKDQLNALTEERINIQHQLHDPSISIRERSDLIRDLKSIGQAIATKRRDYEICVAAALPMPDLVAKTFVIKTNHSDRLLTVAGVIQNVGEAPASGPFDVVLGVSYNTREGSHITRQLNIHVPAGVSIEGFGTPYTTDPMTNIPLLYRDENPQFVYTLEMIVDSTNQISEVSNSNNVISVKYWAVSTAFVSRGSTQFEVRAQSILN
jgi:hypothetical protein